MKRIIKILDTWKIVPLVFTLIYIWVASCMYLFYNVNTYASNACFYGGLVTLVMFLLTSSRIKRLYFNGGKKDD